MTYAALVREYFPDATDDEVEFILWERTAYPFAREETLREQLQALAVAWAEGRDMCGQCGHSFAPPSKSLLNVCDPCFDTPLVGAHPAPRAGDGRP